MKTHTDTTRTITVSGEELTLTLREETNGYTRRLWDEWLEIPGAIDAYWEDIVTFLEDENWAEAAPDERAKLLDNIRVATIIELRFWDALPLRPGIPNKPTE